MTQHIADSEQRCRRNAANTCDPIPAERLRKQLHPLVSQLLGIFLVDYQQHHWDVTPHKLQTVDTTPKKWWPVDATPQLCQQWLEFAGTTKQMQGHPPYRKRDDC
jgi:hypothetical protein